jgi:hypothetical protein
MTGCQAPAPAPPPDAMQADTVARYPSGAPQMVEVRNQDSLVERRWYRSTGMVRRVERGDSVTGYLDLHTLDSSRVLRDYMQGRWRNTSADLGNTRASAFYTFSGDTLTFANPKGNPLETIRVDFRPGRLMVTEDGIPAPAEVASFDTVHVTGYTLVRDSSTTGRSSTTSDPS